MRLAKGTDVPGTNHSVTSSQRDPDLQELAPAREVVQAHGAEAVARLGEARASRSEVEPRSASGAGGLGAPPANQAAHQPLDPGLQVGHERAWLPAFSCRSGDSGDTPVFMRVVTASALSILARCTKW